MILCIYGAGGNGKTLVDLVSIIEKRERHWDKVIFVDDVTDQKRIYDTEVYKFDELEKHFKHEELEFAISLGEPSSRKKLYDKVKSKGYSMPVIIHPDAFLPKKFVAGEGAVITNCSIGSDTVIGANTVISQNAMVAHDVVIGEHCTISASSFIAGHTMIGNEVYIAPMAAVRDRIKVDDHAVVAMSAAVYKDVASDEIAIGNPARNMKKDADYKVFG